MTFKYGENTAQLKVWGKFSHRTSGHGMGQNHYTTWFTPGGPHYQGLGTTLESSSSDIMRQIKYNMMDLISMLEKEKRKK